MSTLTRTGQTRNDWGPGMSLSSAGKEVYSLEYGECSVCGSLEFPVLQRPTCGHDKPMLHRAFSQPGTIYSWTRVGERGSTKTLVMVDFFGGKLRVTAGYEPVGDPEIGSDVTLVRRGSEADGVGYSFV